MLMVFPIPKQVSNERYNELMQAMSPEEIEAHGLIPVKEGFRIIGLSLPVPPYEVQLFEHAVFIAT